MKEVAIFGIAFVAVIAFLFWCLKDDIREDGVHNYRHHHNKKVKK